MNNKKFVILMTVLCLFGIEGYAIQTKKPDFARIPKYENQLRMLINGSREVDFFDLRMSFTQTKEYKPANAWLDSLRSKMVQALKKNEYSNAVTLADSILKTEYVDMYSHYACYYAYSALGDSAEASYHEYIMDRLLNSVVESGDGKTKETAFLVINPNEEYFLLFIYKLQNKEKSFTNYNGEPIDVFKVVDPETKESFELYFNTSIMINSQNK